jgi:hypothetical protein
LFPSGSKWSRGNCCDQQAMETAFTHASSDSLIEINRQLLRAMDQPRPDV